jgi:DNA-directed RNA polymerase subunit RPC12/RpoP
METTRRTKCAYCGKRLKLKSIGIARYGVCPGCGREQPAGSGSTPLQTVGRTLAYLVSALAILAIVVFVLTSMGG